MCKDIRKVLLILILYNVLSIYKYFLQHLDQSDTHKIFIILVLTGPQVTIVILTLRKNSELGLLSKYTAITFNILTFNIISV